MPSNKIKAKSIPIEEFYFRYQEETKEPRKFLATLVKDFKVDFDVENIDFSCFPEGDSFLGVRCLDYKSVQLPFAICRASGDWQFPIYFVVYISPADKFRAYIPKNGNTYNFDTKTAFGEDEESDNKFIKKWLKKNFPEEEFNEDSTIDNYVELMEDFNNMVLDIKLRLEVV